MNTNPMNVNFRIATAEDLPALIGMLADDHLGAEREDFSDPINPAYVEAFNNIESDPNNDIVVGVIDGKVIGTLQMTMIPNLSFLGSTRCIVQAVRISSELRGQGLGRKLMDWSVKRALSLIHI